MAILLNPDAILFNPDAMHRPTIEIGLLNNFSDKGLQAGERQIVTLLRAAHDGPIKLHFFTLPGIARGQGARTRIKSVYTPFETLFRTRLDGLFVTGCEPFAPDLHDETFWPALTEVIDWAETHTASTIWSCLAAHAAVLHRDGIARRRLPKKCTGLFPVERATAHPLLAGCADTLVVPHSRYNDLSETELAAAGYTILTRHPTIGVDTFLRQRRSLFLFLQGHPEYDSGALAREYRRDTTRFEAGLSDMPPPRPENYFETTHSLSMDTLKACAESFAITLFRNWLAHLTADAMAHAD